MADDAAPLILTLQLDDRSQATFNELRRAHFPPGRNHLDAHVTLFHALPGNRLDEVVAVVERSAQRPPFDVAVVGLRSLGRGVAYVLESEELSGLRAGLAEAWHALLTRQDAQGFRPHVTVQNKVEPDEAKAVHTLLLRTFTPWRARADGLALSHYRGGPWDHHRSFPFVAPGSST